MFLILSDFQNGDRNAKVYKTTLGDYGVILYDAQDDYNEFKSFPVIEQAENFAEDWVSGHVTF
jgi:hypothetical protein